ncbi:hypothetical protein SCHPADRAFT_996847 [Schizopora paradoxa]|uniref:Uncharacterized protein n=1 Tax=Schizopora paradoxa TaxID=27342 RepID=A0A0H2RXD9_9AGAM|nr:hypothetical protein SCHPADRAFT_996847 [Schizopora paradoxa]
MESRSNPSLRPASDHDDVRAKKTKIDNGCIDPNIPPSHTPLVPIDALEDDEDLFLDTHAIDTVASPPHRPDFTTYMTPAFEITDEEGTIVADVYIANSDGQEDLAATTSNDDEDAPSDGEVSTEDSEIMGHLSNRSDDSLIFPFSPPLQATNLNDIAEDTALAPFSLYDFPRHDFEGIADRAFEFDEPESDEDNEDEDSEIFHRASSPFPRAPWLSDDQDAHFKFV